MKYILLASFFISLNFGIAQTQSLPKEVRKTFLLQEVTESNYLEEDKTPLVAPSSITFKNDNECVFNYSDKSITTTYSILPIQLQMIIKLDNKDYTVDVMQFNTDGFKFTYGGFYYSFMSK